MLLPVSTTVLELLIPGTLPPYCRWQHAGLVSLTSEHRGTATVKRQTGLVSRNLGRSNILGPGIKRTIVSMSILSDLYRQYSPVISQSPCVYDSPPVQGIVTCVRVGGDSFELHKQAWYGFCNFPKFSRSGNFFPGNGKFFRDPGKSSPVNIPKLYKGVVKSQHLSYRMEILTNDLFEGAIIRRV